LTVAVNRLRRWTRPGWQHRRRRACVSPIGGVSVNLAVGRGRHREPAGSEAGADVNEQTRRKSAAREFQ
jgi:hypothetical protein